MSFRELLVAVPRIFVTYPWGKPQLPLAGECEGDNPAAGRTQISYEKHQPGRLGTKEKIS